MRPDKKIREVKVKSITKKIKDKTFAAKVDRSAIKDIEKIGLSYNNFIEIALNAMKEIAEEIGM